MLAFEAEAATVVGTPFGIDVPRLTTVTGTFTYQTDGAIDSNSSPDRGEYRFAGGATFTAGFLGHTVTGSATPLIEVQDFSSSETFRYDDGGDEHAMSFDGTPDPSIDLWLSITDGSASSLAGDSLPAPFPMPFAPEIEPRLPHTFSLADYGGTLLLQLVRLEQIEGDPDRPIVTAVGLAGDGAPTLEFRSRSGNRYGIEFSTDLEIWVQIAQVEAASALTEFTDSGLAGRSGGALPGRACYRIRALD